jgi:hypothetical protein
MSKFLVRLADGTYVEKAATELEDDDMVIVDGPGAFAESEKLQAELDKEILEAGGLEQWRARVGASQY